jgi:hypothetical protein
MPTLPTLTRLGETFGRPSWAGSFSRCPPSVETLGYWQSSLRDLVALPKTIY